MQEARYGWVAFSLIFSVAALFSRAYRWGLLIEPLGSRPKLRNLFYSVCSGYLANLAFPRLGEVTRCTVLYEVEEAPFDKLFGTVIAERVVDLISLILLIFLTVISNSGLFGHFFANQLKEKLSFLTQLSALHLAVFGLIGLGFLLLINGLRKKILANPIAVKVVDFLKGILSGLQSVLKLKRKRAFLFHTAFIWGMYYFSCYFIFFAIPETSVLGFRAGLFILVRNPGHCRLMLSRR